MTDVVVVSIEPPITEARNENLRCGGKYECHWVAFLLHALRRGNGTSLYSGSLIVAGIGS